MTQHPPADPVYPRIDLLVFNHTNDRYEIVTGAPGPNPVPRTPPENTELIRVVRIEPPWPRYTPPPDEPCPDCVTQDLRTFGGGWARRLVVDPCEKHELR